MNFRKFHLPTFASTILLAGFGLIMPCKATVINLASTGSVSHIFSPEAGGSTPSAYDLAGFAPKNGQSIINLDGSSDLDIRLTGFASRQFVVSGDLNSFSVTISFLITDQQMALSNLAVSFLGGTGNLPAPLVTTSSVSGNFLDITASFSSPFSQPFSFLGLEFTANIPTQQEGATINFTNGSLKVGNSDLPSNTDVAPAMSLQAVPEPSILAISCFAAAGAISRRRRQIL